jgi:nucleotide-binding universal stress UspA family protein
MATRSQSILVGFDGSDAARRALDAAASLVGYGSTLAVVSVGPEGRPVPRRPLVEARDRLLTQQIQASYLEQVGDPAEQLVQTARELDVDLVVVGRRKSSLQRLVLGSVSAKVVRRAPCDVLVVR